MAFQPGLRLAPLSPRTFAISTPDDGGKGWAYFLCAQPRTDQPSFTTLWTSASGIVLFTNNPIDDADGDAMADLLQQQLATPAASPVPWRVVAWTSDPYLRTDLDGFHASQSQPGVFTLRRGWSRAWGPLGLTLDQELTVRLGTPDDPSVLSVDIAPHDVSLFHFTLAGKQQPVGYSKDGFHMPIRLSGQGTGSLRIPLGLDPSTLFCAFRCGLIYRVGSALVFFPMVPALPRTINQVRAFDIWLNPIRPLDATCTRFSVDGSGRLANPGFPHPANDALAAPYFSSPAGAPLTLHPFDPGPAAPDAVAGGFAFSLAPSAAVPGAAAGTTAMYLSPCGLYRAGDGTAAQRLMLGMAGTEFLLLGPDDRLEFMPNNPASATSFGAPGAAGALLDTSVTTSWLRVQPGTGEPPAYFSQPASSGFYGGRNAYPLAMDVQLASFTSVSGAFPAVPYGGVYLPVPSDANTAYLPPFAGSPDLLVQLEATVFASLRHGLLATSPNGPVFMPEGALQPDPSLDRAATPGGLLLELNVAAGSPIGSIQRLNLATSPAATGIAGDAPPLLRFLPNSAGVVPPVLGNLLTCNQCFLVVSMLPADVITAGFENILELGGFKLQFDVGTPGGTVLVFKFNDTEALSSLVQRPAVWAAARTFNFDPVAISTQLGASIDAARGADNAEAFATFQTLVDDAAWTGVLAFNVQVDGNGMPLGLQALLGGIQGDLRAHHIGVETNKMAPHAGHSFDLIQSSLFGVIRYDAPPAPPTPVLDYEVEHLLVVFSNSSITQSEATIGVTFATMFGRTVWLENATIPNTLSIDGVSQVVDGADTITFTTSTPFNFDFTAPPKTPPVGPRVLQRVEITHASLVPISSTTAADGSATVLVRLLTTGQIWFAADPFSAGIDLLSYGTSAGNNPAAGMAFTGLTVEIGFQLNGSMVPGTKTVTLREDLVQAAPDSDAIRPGSFLAAMPAQFTRLITTGTALTTEATGATPIQIIALEPAGKPPYTTAKPQWALEYDLHLGSLGSISDDHAGLAAKLLLGWGPSPVAADQDAVAMLIQLPHLGGGSAGFSLEGLLTTTFGDANLLCVDVTGDGPVYAILFNNVQLALLGHAFPPGMLVDFAIFAGAPPGTQRNTNNVAWFLGAVPQTQPATPP